MKRTAWPASSSRLTPALALYQCSIQFIAPNISSRSKRVGSDQSPERCSAAMTSSQIASWRSFRLMMRARRQLARDDGLEVGERLRQALLDDGDQDVLLALEVVEPAAGLDADRAGNVAHRRVGVAALAEQQRGLRDDVLAQAVVLVLHGTAALARRFSGRGGEVVHAVIGRKSRSRRHGGGLRRAGIPLSCGHASR